MVDTALTFEEYTQQVEEILSRTDTYSFLIEGDVRVSRRPIEPFGIMLCFTGMHSNPTRDQLELFARVHHLAEEVQERWHREDNPNCDGCKAKAKREHDRSTSATADQ